MGFQGHFEEAGSRGSAIFVSMREPLRPLFIFQFRAIEIGAVVPTSEGRISLVTDVQIQFCPWCGANLIKWYGKFLKELDKSELQIGP
jgi:hypothetical protein